MIPHFAWIAGSLLVACELAPAAEISGSITPEGEMKEGDDLCIGCASLDAKGELEVDNHGLTIPKAGDHKKLHDEGPRLRIDRDEKGGWSYALADRAVGEHLLCITFTEKSSPARQTDWLSLRAWKWVSVKDAKERLRVDLSFPVSVDPKRAGAIEVKGTEGDTPNQITFVPIEGVDPAAPILAKAFFIAMGFNLFDYHYNTPRLEGVPPGKYRVRADSAWADIEVKAGETAHVRLALRGPWAEISGTITPKGELKGEHPWITFFGLDVEGEVTAAQAGIEGKETEDRAAGQWGGHLEIRKSESGWKYTLREIPPGFYLLRAQYAHDANSPHFSDQHPYSVPTVWKWVEVKEPKQKLTVDFEVELAPDPSQLGSVVAEFPPNEGGDYIEFVPLDGIDPSASVVAALGDELDLRSALHWEQHVSKGTKTFKGLRPGRYRFIGSRGLTDMFADVEVKAGETTTAKLAPAGEKK